ncbi:MAG: efflux RND transporter permease subunit [Candidatus Sumerlaeaceae bacterium]
MIKKLGALALRHPRFTIAAALFLLGFTLWRLPYIPVDVFPELNAPTVVVLTEAGGLAADEVEQFVTVPLESAFNGLMGVRRVRTSSALSLSIVWVEFDWGEDIYRARQLVAERLSSAKESLPRSAHAEIAPVSSLTGEIMLIALSSPDGSVSPLDLRAYAEFDLRNRLLAVPGISQVVAIGGELPEYQVNVRQDRLMLYGLTAKDVVEAAGEAHSIAGAGYLANIEGKELPLRQSGRVRTVEDIRQTVLKYEKGAPVTIGQVADVEFAGAPKRGTGAEGGKAAVIVSIQKAPGTNTLSLTREIDRALDEAEKGLPEGSELNRDVMRQSHFISTSVHNVVSVLRDAAILVAIIVVLFLMNWRATLITLTALPLSLAVAFLILDAFGLNINVMTLGGLAVAIGELVDDAIIYVENIIRRLAENAARPPELRRSKIRIIYSASNEIRSSVIYATIIICIVFVPLLFLQGLEGRFFRPLGLAYIASIMGSLLVALTVTPAMCRLLIPAHGSGKQPPQDGEGMAHSHGHGHGQTHDGRFVRWLKQAYAPLLHRAMRWKKSLLAMAVAATVASLALASTFGTSFLPEFNEGTFTVFLMMPPGTSLDESNRLATGVEKRLIAITGVQHVSRRTGRAERDQHAEPVSSSEIEVSVKPGHTKDEVRRGLDAVLGALPGVTTNIGQPIEHRLSHVLSGTPAAIAIDVYGEDLGVLRGLAKEIDGILRTIPGARDIAANREIMIDSVPIVYRPGELARWGITPADAARQVQIAFSGEPVAEVNQGTKRFQLVVRLAPEARSTIEQVGDFLLRGKGGAMVRVRDVAEVGVERTSNLIARENGRRKAVISCNVAEGANLGDLVREVQAKVDPVVAKAGYSVHYGGQFEAQQSASRTIYIMGAGVVLIILALLTMALGSMWAAGLVMINLPLALIGGIVAVYLTAPGTSAIANTGALLGIGTYRAPILSIASMVGFVTLFGIAVRNGILLVNHYAHLILEEKASLSEAVVRGSMERLVPILMTALAAILGLIPLAMAAGEPGGELLAPLAIVVLGGLVTSTFLNLFVVPASYMLVFSRRPLIAKHSAEDEELTDEAPPPVRNPAMPQPATS